MASPMIDFCEQTNPKVLTEVRRIKRFENATRIHNGLTSNPEKRALIWMAERTPRWISSDHLTLLGFVAQVMAGVSYALAALEPLLAPGRNLFPGPQLAGRQSRRHTGPGPPAAASALRLLRGPHRRQLRRPGAHGRAGAVGIHASLHRDRPAGWRSCCSPSSLTWPPTRWENFNSRSGVLAPPNCAFCCRSATSRSCIAP